jgi:pseudaminic acid synthase
MKIAETRLGARTLIQIENKQIGLGCKPLLIAELSANHDKDLSQSLALIDMAADAGWDAFKLQTYTAESLTMKSSHHSLDIDPVWGHANLYDLYSDAAMPMEFHKPLFERARSRGMLPFTSVYDPRDLLFTEELNCSIYKIASFELTFDDLLVEIALTKKPVIISTGMANLKEVEHALDILEQNNSGAIVLLHCVSAYPTPFEEVNLLAMETLRSQFGKMVGFSDHTIGSKASIHAAMLGAVAIEKHVTNDMNRKGPDHRFSATCDVLREISDGVSEAFVARGSGSMFVSKSEVVSKKVGRRSAYAIRDLQAGTKITDKDFRFIRPGAGIPANDKKSILGKRLKVDISCGHPILYTDLFE